MNETLEERIARIENQIDKLKMTQITSTEHFTQLDLHQIAVMVDNLATSRWRMQTDYKEAMRKLRMMYPMTITALTLAALAIGVLFAALWR